MIKMLVWFIKGRYLDRAHVYCFMSIKLTNTNRVKVIMKFKAFVSFSN